MKDLVIEKEIWASRCCSLARSHGSQLISARVLLCHIHVDRSDSMSKDLLDAERRDDDARGGCLKNLMISKTAQADRGVKYYR